MKTVNKMISGLFGLAILGALCYGAYFALKHVVAAPFAKLDQQVAVVTAIAAATLLLSALIIASGMRWAKEREHEHRQRAERAALYERLLNAWSETRRQETGNNHVGKSQSPEDLPALEKQLLLRGHANVLKAYTAFRKLEKEAGPQNPAAKSAFVKILFAMRKDLGLSTEGLNEEDLRLTIDDLRLTIGDLRFPIYAIQNRQS
jgi:hypothetical protein